MREPHSIRIATWNLQCVRPGTGARTARISSAIAKVDTDVWVLTETHEHFSPGERYKEVAYSIPASDRKDGERWVAIWVLRDLDAVKLKIAGEPGRSAAARISLGEGRHLIVFGTVLPWRGDTATKLRGAAKFQSSLAVQVQDWKKLRQQSPGDSFCAAGDFNQEFQSNGPVGTKLGRAALDDVLFDAELTCLTGGNRDPLLKRGWGKSIDHILIDDALASSAHAAAVWPDEFPLSRKMSDHYGVCVKLRNRD